MISVAIIGQENTTDFLNPEQMSSMVIPTIETSVEMLGGEYSITTDRSDNGVADWAQKFAQVNELTINVIPETEATVAIVFWDGHDRDTKERIRVLEQYLPARRIHVAYFNNVIQFPERGIYATS